MEYYLIGDMEKAIKYHQRAMNNTLEMDTSPAKKASGLSIWKKNIYTINNKYSNILNQKDYQMLMEDLKKARNKKKDLDTVRLEDVLRKKLKWEPRDLPSARMSKYNFRQLNNQASFPDIFDKKSTLQKSRNPKLNIQIPLYSHLSLKRISILDFKANVFGKPLKELKLLDEMLYDDFFKS